MSKVHVKTGDTVILLTGKDEYLYNDKDNKSKGRKTGQVGGIVETEGALYASKVQLVCPKCGQPTRVGHVIEDGKKLRVCKKCGKSFE